MTIKDIKNFLEQFDNAEEVVDIIFEKDMDICQECDNYYDEIDDNCANMDRCSCNKHKDIYTLRMAFNSDVTEDGYICGNDYHNLIIEDSE